MEKIDVNIQLKKKAIEELDKYLPDYANKLPNYIKREIRARRRREDLNIKNIKRTFEKHYNYKDKSINLKRTNSRMILSNERFNPIKYGAYKTYINYYPENHLDVESFKNVIDELNLNALRYIIETNKSFVLPYIGYISMVIYNRHSRRKFYPKLKLYVKNNVAKHLRLYSIKSSIIFNVVHYLKRLKENHPLMHEMVFFKETQL